MTKIEERGWWSIRLKGISVRIVRVEISNLRDTCCKGTPVGYILWVYPSAGFDNNTNYVYQDRTPEPTRWFDVVPDPRILWPTSSLMIQAVLQPINASFTFCEVAIFGDTYCSEGKFGRNCERSCNCADQGACFVSTGGCPSGCAPGYTGEDCWTPCETNKYGSGCQGTCSENCAGGAVRSCSSSDGTCNYGCKPGYHGPLCKEPCGNGTYGALCRQRCSDYCEGGSQACHNVNGTCHHGCIPGYKTPFCTEVCKVGTYGPGCTKNCSEFCAGKVKTCTVLDGSCLQGCMPGYQAPLCTNKNAPPSTKGPQLWMIILAVAVSVIAVVNVIAVVLWLRRKSPNRKRRKPIPLDDKVSATQADSSESARGSREETRPPSRGVAMSTQPFSNYDIIPASDPARDAIHTYATDFDPYDHVLERIYENASSEPFPTVEAEKTDKARESQLPDNGQYIQLEDVRSSNNDATETTEFSGKDGDYLTPIDGKETGKAGKPEPQNNGQYIRMEDVRSSGITATETTEFPGKDGDYLTPIDDEQEKAQPRTTQAHSDSA
ncbi:multiple epidermal growth factor-like domains 10 [Elysia marginata]|uniref:Multiple epidermal growth factor-like domains 10 n=1 Tax=Elysia marginata TaxID=1093978 RepID=A0AAV4HSQ6_9GAST|nr:multiple epidermal growth factor-like domains 10 [Elysia marginata]